MIDMYIKEAYMELSIQEIAKDYVDGEPFESMLPETAKRVMGALQKLYDADNKTSYKAKEKIVEEILTF